MLFLRQTKAFLRDLTRIRNGIPFPGNRSNPKTLRISTAEEAEVLGVVRLTGHFDVPESTVVSAIFSF